MGIGLSDVFASFFLPDRLEATQAANGNKMAKRWRQKYPDYQVGKKGLGNGGGDLKKLASTVLLDME